MDNATEATRSLAMTCQWAGPTAELASERCNNQRLEARVTQLYSETCGAVATVDAHDLALGRELHAQFGELHLEQYGACHCV